MQINKSTLFLDVLPCSGVSCGALVRHEPAGVCDAEQAELREPGEGAAAGAAVPGGGVHLPELQRQEQRRLETRVPGTAVLRGVECRSLTKREGFKKKN